MIGSDSAVSVGLIFLTIKQAEREADLCGKTDKTRQQHYPDDKSQCDSDIDMDANQAGDEQ